MALLPRAVFDIPLLDPAAGVSFCGDAEAYLAALETFANSIESRAEEIEACLAAMDLPNYTLKVHALKSTSRAIGAGGLSKRAEALELAGNAGDTAAIARDTPDFLAAYRGMPEPLRSLFASAEPADLPLLPEAEFDDALATIHDLCASYDDTSVQMVMDMLKNYAIPDSRRERYARLKAAVDRVDWEQMAAASAPES